MKVHVHELIYRLEMLDPHMRICVVDHFGQPMDIDLNSAFTRCLLEDGSTVIDVSFPERGEEPD